MPSCNHNFSMAKHERFWYVAFMASRTFPQTALRGPVPLSHLLLQHYVQAGDHVVDATVGNGYDTLLLAELVGEQGKVWGFDIQPQALEATRQKVHENGCGERVTLIHAGHECIAEHCSQGMAAVVFNLGYLPGGDRTIITTTATTLAACNQALRLLKPGGIMPLTLYPGHSGGDDEQVSLEKFARELSPREFHVWQMRQSNVSATAPYTILIQKVP